MCVLLPPRAPRSFALLAASEEDGSGALFPDPLSTEPIDSFSSRWVRFFFSVPKSATSRGPANSYSACRSIPLRVGNNTFFRDLCVEISNICQAFQPLITSYRLSSFYLSPESLIWVQSGTPKMAHKFSTPISSIAEKWRTGMPAGRLTSNRGNCTMLFILNTT